MATTTKIMMTSFSSSSSIMKLQPSKTILSTTPKQRLYHVITAGGVQKQYRLPSKVTTSSSYHCSSINYQNQQRQQQKYQQSHFHQLYHSWCDTTNKYRTSRTTKRLMSSSSSSSSSSSNSMYHVWNPTEEHAALRSSLRTFVQREVEQQADEYNKKEIFNINLFQQLGNNNLGVLGLTVDEAYGGTGWLDATAVAIVHEELAYSDPAFCLAYLAHSLLLVNNLHINSTNEEQKHQFLPGCCDGTTIGGMCMSEPNAGTDVLGMKTNAKLDNNTGNWILNGTKMWITNGTLDGQTTGDLFLVYAKTGPSKFDVTQFIVTKNMPGFTLGQQIHGKLGMRASMTAELVFDNVVIPPEHIVGNINQATKCMMRNLEIERIGLAAMAIGIARRCLNEMKNYALSRQAFNSNDLLEFGQIQKMIADSYVEYMAGRCYVYNTAKSLDLQSTGNGMDADGTKLFCANMSKNIADRAIQVMGGYGYVSEYTVERLWRDAKLLEIGGGTNESHHKNIARDIRKVIGIDKQFE